MARGRGRYKRVMQVPSAEDKEYIRLLNTGMKKAAAFRKAYPNHKTVRRFEDSIGEERHKAAVSIQKTAYDKMDSKYMQKAMNTYQKRMDVFSDAAVETAIELVTAARSEKVRADLAIEGMRQKVGTPTQQVNVQEEKQIFIGFGKPPERDQLDDLPKEARDYIEGEVVDSVLE